MKFLPKSLEKLKMIRNYRKKCTIRKSFWLKTLLAEEHIFFILSITFILFLGQKLHFLLSKIKGLGHFLSS